MRRLERIRADKNDGLSPKDVCPNTATYIYISGECAVVCNHSPEFNNQFKDSLQAYFHSLAFNFDDVDTFRLYR